MIRASPPKNWPGSSTISTHQDPVEAPEGFAWVLLRRPSLWAVGMANFGLDFINFMFLTWYPSYLTETYHMSLGRMGVMAMEPYVLGVIAVLGAASWCAKCATAAWI